MVLHATGRLYIVCLVGMEEVTEDYQNLCTKIQVVPMNAHSSTVTISVSARSLILSVHTVIYIRQNMC